MADRPPLMAELSGVGNSLESGFTYAVVATVRAILLVELKSKTVTPLEWHRPEYYGISWRPDGQHLILTHSMLDNNNLKDVSSYALSEKGVLSEGPTTTAPFLSQPHQIIFAGDNRIICTNTGRNAISIFNPGKPTILQESRFSDARWDRLSLDSALGDHLNSVFEKEGILYVVAHRHSKGSALITLNYPDLELLAIEPIKDRTGLHNIWVTGDGQRIACHSEAGSVVELNSASALWESGAPVHTRGLAASADFVLIGESERTQRALRSHSMSGLWLVDRRTWRALDYYCLGHYGAVHEVRLLNMTDEAHHGHRFAGLDALLSRDSREEMATERLKLANRVLASRTRWRLFDLVFGSPVFTNNGGQQADASNLCLCVLRACSGAGHAAPALRFSYSLDDVDGDSHVAIVAYSGFGGDSHMSALLIQRGSDTHARMSLWLHDGQSWSGLVDDSIDRLPLSGEVTFAPGDEAAKLKIDNTPIQGACVNRFQSASGKLGIRWIGATIWPAGD